MIKMKIYRGWLSFLLLVIAKAQSPLPGKSLYMVGYACVFVFKFYFTISAYKLRKYLL